MTEDRLTVPEKAELKECEAVIERGERIFLDVGSALLAIRNGKLYRGDFATFEEYVETRWSFSQRRANQYIESARPDIRKNFSQILPKLPPVESHYRELAAVSADAVPEVLAAVAAKTQDGTKVTATLIREVRHQVVGDSAPEKKKPKPKLSKGEQWRQCPTCDGAGKVPVDLSTLIPSALDTPAFREKWAEWLAVCKENRKPMKPTRAKKQLAALEQMGAAEAIKALECSMQSGWQGVFPEKKQKGSRHDPKRQGMAYVQ